MLRNLAVSLSQPQLCRCRNSARSCMETTPTAVSSRRTRWSVTRSIRHGGSTSRLTAPSRSRLRGRTVRRIRRRGVDSKGLRPVEQGQRPGASGAQAVFHARRPRHRSSWSTAVHGDHGSPDRRSFEPGLHSDDGDGRAARRRVRLAHHEEHPRRQGLHLLALQRVVGALPRCAGPRTRTSRRR